MNRICPREEVLSKYLEGVLEPNLREKLEEHLAGCDSCRLLLMESYEVVSSLFFYKITGKIARRVRQNRWLIGSILAFTASFLVPRYFLQLLVICLITGAKWIVDSKSMKTLIMINETGKHLKGDKSAALKKREG